MHYKSVRLGTAVVGGRACVEISVADMKLDESHAEGLKCPRKRGEIEKPCDDPPWRSDVYGRRIAAGCEVIDVGLQKHLVPRHSPGKPSSNEPVDQLRREPQPRALARKHAPNNECLRWDVDSGDYTLAEHSAVERLPSCDPTVGHAQGHLDLTNHAHLLRELGGFEACLVVGASHCAVERQMAFKHARAHCHRGQGNRSTHVMAGVTDRTARPLSQPLHETQIDLFRRRWISAYAVKEGVVGLAIFEERQ